jgi:hypothetical protein
LLLAAAVRGRDEKGGEAWRRALEDDGAGLLFAALGAILLLALDGEGRAGLAAFAAALIFFPALMVALWTILPRYRSVEESLRD